jgi:hypothetical protein
MPTVKGGEKYLTLRLTQEEHKTLKVKSALRGLSIKKYILNLVNNDEEELIIETVNEDELTAEEREAIEEGRRDIAEGRYMSFDEYMKGRV